jgi:hypothetical protein
MDVVDGAGSTARSSSPCALNETVGKRPMDDHRNRARSAAQGQVSI